MLKYDNCKNCVRLCEYAGKDREFVCPGGVSCKQVNDPVVAFGEKEMIAAALHLLDVQRAHCIEHGAEKGARWFSIDGPGDPGQNSYYNGHMNMLDAMILSLRKVVAIGKDGKHYIADFPE